MRPSVQRGLMVAGLLVVPVTGLAYAAVAGFGAHQVSSSAVASVPRGDQESDQEGVSTAPRRPAGAPSTDAKACCSALDGNRMSAPQRYAEVFTGALEACRAASSPTEAKRRVATLLNAARIAVPAACKAP